MNITFFQLQKFPKFLRWVTTQQFHKRPDDGSSELLEGSNSSSSDRELERRVGQEICPSQESHAIP